MRKGKGRTRPRSRSLARADVSAAVATRQFGALVVNLAQHAIAIDVSKLEAPERAYDADVAWVEHVVGAVTLVFAKGDRDDPSHLKSRLEVRFPPEDLLLTFWSNSRSFFDRLRRYVAKWPEEARLRSTPPTTLPALQSHSEWASFAYMSHAGTEGAIDFYHITPSALARVAQGLEVSGRQLRAIVRVQLTTFELLNLVERVQPLIDVVREYLPAVHTQAKEVQSSFGTEDHEDATEASREYGS